MHTKVNRLNIQDYNDKTCLPENLMAYVIPALTAILFLISLALFLFSEFTQRHLYFFFDPKWINLVIVFRMLAGFVVIAAAPASAAPMLMILVGVAIIFIAFTTPFT
ncbi:MAG: hypothetical protein QM504_14540, partial [Pseudomonadota bacterium]